MIIRVTDTAIDPEDLDRCTTMLRERISPALGSLSGSRGIEIHVRVDERHGDLVEVAIVSRWDHRDAMELAVRSDEYTDAMAEFRPLFQQAPIVRIFEVAD
ncbi:MAG: antibiotic biosynthesis monooxygenase family protein [Actinomycetota bacterium]